MEKKVILFFFILILGVLIAGCSSSNTNYGDVDNNSETETVTENFLITGFTWPSCADIAQRVLSRLDGVKQVNVEESGDTEITYESKIVDADIFREALEPYNFSLEK